MRDCLIFLASIPTSLVTLYLGSVLNGTHRFVAFNVVRTTVFVGNAAGLVALALASELTVTSAMFAYLASQVLTVLIAVILVLPSTGSPSRPERLLAREMLAYGFRSQLSTISNLLNERVDQLVISIVLAPASLGLFVVALDHDVAVQHDRFLGHVRGASQGGPGGVGARAQSKGPPARLPHLRRDRSGHRSSSPSRARDPSDRLRQRLRRSYRRDAGVSRRQVPLGTGRVLEAVLRPSIGRCTPGSPRAPA